MAGISRRSKGPSPEMEPNSRRIAASVSSASTGPTTTTWAFPGTYHRA
jgi:hypothetical protein